MGQKEREGDGKSLRKIRNERLLPMLREREYDICSICSWENDPIQEEHPDMRGGANVMSLYEAKQTYKSGAKVI